MPVISPDSRWIAYVSLESGREEVYVRPLPDVDRARWQVSPARRYQSDVGSQSGKELFYVSRGDSLVAASVERDLRLPGDRTASAVRHGAVRVPALAPELRRPPRRPLVHHAGAVAEASGPEARRLVVVLNWFTDVQARFARAE